MEHKHGRTCSRARNTEKGGKWEMHTVGPGIWRENGKILQMKNTHCRTWNMARNTQKREKWEKYFEGPGL